MLNLIQNLSYYMSVEVVEPAWHTLAEDIASCSTVASLLCSLHCIHSFENRLMRCLLSMGTS